MNVHNMDVLDLPVVVNADIVTCVYIGDENVQYVFEMPHTTSIAKRKRAAISFLVDMGYADANEYNVLIRKVDENGVKYKLRFETVMKCGTRIIEEGK